MKAVCALQHALDKYLQIRHGLTVTQYEILEAVSKLDKPTICGVMDQVGKAYSTGTVLFDRLERHGWIERQRSAKDRRVIYLVLKDSNRFLEIQRQVEALMTRLDLNVLEELLKRITSATKRVAAG